MLGTVYRSLTKRLNVYRETFAFSNKQFFCNDKKNKYENPSNVPLYKLEQIHENKADAVEHRREILQNNGHDMSGIPFKESDYAKFYDDIYGRNCENVVGYSMVPIGVVGPLMINGKQYTVPLSTTEGALLASTNRGCSIINKNSGIKSIVINDGMTRAPVIECNSLEQTLEVRKWIESEEGFDVLCKSFGKTTSHGKLKDVQIIQYGRYLHLRFKAYSGDAMGMNMLTKGCDQIVRTLIDTFNVRLVTLSGNCCTDKKPSYMNWLLGRGKSVVSEVLLSNESVKTMLHTDIDRLIDLNIQKNLIGSSLAGTVGGNNAHSANIVAGIFLATGQDLGQVVESSFCMTTFEKKLNDSVLMTCTMPCIEVGTIGGGTRLPSQLGCMKLLNLPAANTSQELAKIVCSTVLCGELSLIAAQCSGDLVNAHLKYNRK